MTTEAFIPDPPLSSFVSCFWIRRRPAEAVRELALPTGTAELVINLRDERLRVVGRNSLGEDGGFRDGVICGPHSEYFLIDSAANEEVIGVNFRPGGIFPFLDTPSDHLQNSLLPLDAVWGSRAVQLRDELVNARSNLERFRVLERFLLQRAYRPLLLDPRVTHALRVLQSSSGPFHIAGLAEEAGLSQRRFIELFRTTTGLSPKQYFRVRRLQAALRAIERGEVHSWADVAYSHGYYDQSHFNRDFHAMTGMIPSEYAARLGDRPNHVPV